MLLRVAVEFVRDCSVSSCAGSERLQAQHNSFSIGCPETLLSPCCNQMHRSNELDKDSQVSPTETRLRSLLLQGLAGEASAYHAFLKELAGYLRAFLRKRLGHWPDEVEDLLQETLLAVHNQRHTYDPTQPLTAWVHAIAKYKLVDLLRRRASREHLNDPLDDEVDVLSSADGDAAEARRDLHQLLLQLPDQATLAHHSRKAGGAVGGGSGESHWYVCVRDKSGCAPWPESPCGQDQE